MYFSRLTLNRDVNRHTYRRVSKDGGYSVHQHIWKLFGTGNGSQRSFIYHIDECSRWPRIYVVSGKPPNDTEYIWKLETKEYNPQLTDGMHLSFKLRVNPVRTRRDEHGKHKRHDIVMDEKKRLENSGIPKNEWPTKNEIAHEQAVDWLIKRANINGFSVDKNRIMADSYTQRTLYKGKGKKNISISTIDLTGALTVTNPDKFLTALYQGIGPAKGFGCGMLMVRKH